VRHDLEDCCLFQTLDNFFPSLMYAATRVNRRGSSSFRLHIVFGLHKMCPLWLLGCLVPMSYLSSGSLRIIMSSFSMAARNRPACGIANFSLKWKCSMRHVKVWPNPSSRWTFPLMDFALTCYSQCIFSLQRRASTARIEADSKARRLFVQALAI
jgi:hypothetical protein